MPNTKKQKTKEKTLERLEKAKKAKENLQDKVKLKFKPANWKDMETAPLDGSEVWLKSLRRTDKGYWSSYYKMWVNSLDCETEHKDVFKWQEVSSVEEKESKKYMAFDYFNSAQQQSTVMARRQTQEAYDLLHQGRDQSRSERQLLGGGLGQVQPCDPVTITLNSLGDLAGNAPPRPSDPVPQPVPDNFESGAMYTYEQIEDSVSVPLPEAPCREPEMGDLSSGIQINDAGNRMVLGGPDNQYVYNLTNGEWLLEEINAFDNGD